MPVDSTLLHQITLGLAGVLLIVAAYSDSRRYRIPNWICIALIVLFPFAVLTSPYTIAWEKHLVVFALVLALGYLLFMKKIAGAGDIKLIAALSLWGGPNLVGVFLVTTAIAGGFLSLILALIYQIRNKFQADGQTVALTKIQVPYGVAIAVGGLCLLTLLSHPVPFSPHDIAEAAQSVFPLSP